MALERGNVRHAPEAADLGVDIRDLVPRIGFAQLGQHGQAPAVARLSG